MQRNFILTDVMNTGYHVDLERFIKMNTLDDQSFDMTGEYYTLHNYDLDSYDRKFAMIDVRLTNITFKDNPQFNAELKSRCNLLHSQGFVFIKTNPWESAENIRSKPQYPKIDIEHIKWLGDTSWFWFYMYDKHIRSTLILIIQKRNFIFYISTRTLDHTELTFTKNY